ncbi:RadC family protein [Pseudomonas sp. LRF_L74]|uniref:RadC family protein n=1 Tax=Pseudomonas sp. LRF_L74 TaxID=3369422 RepID=UPI003F626BE4
MTTQLSLIQTPKGCDEQRRHEDWILAQARIILEHRMYTRGEELSSPEAVRTYLKFAIGENEHEVFGVVFLDSKHRVLNFEVMFYGSIDGASVYPRQVVKRALANNAAAVILTHNHPSGISTPSEADRILTARLKEALLLIEVHVLDHFIVGKGEPLSMAEMGWL